jgi:multicomponent Na+:H+ antiporter subunit D
MIGVLMASPLLNVAYLLPPVAKGFFLKGDEPHDGWAEAGVLVWLPPALTALGCVVLFFFAGSIQDFLMPLVQP